MGTKNNPGKFDCYANAEPDEPMFVLLGRDKHAPDLVRLWALLRHEDGETEAKVSEALQCADAMSGYLRSKGKMAHNADTLLVKATEGMLEHPDGYEHPCLCNLCLSYADD